MTRSRRSKIAILGTRGIPNLYGGFEQFAEYVSVGLAERGYEVVVYSPHFHPYKRRTFKSVGIVRRWCPEALFGAAAHIVYDLLCLFDAVRRGADVVLELGYASSAISMLVVGTGGTKLVTNVDGLEWKRRKWGVTARRYTRWAERICVQRSDAIVSDNAGVQEYIFNTYGVQSSMIPYGADVFDRPATAVLPDIGVEANEYYLLIARLEPENHIEEILTGYLESGVDRPFLVIGNHETSYGRFLIGKYRHKSVKFLGGIYDIGILNNLRFHSRTYFHGHSVGGTNPSLLEAMAASSLIVAHDNVFNRTVLGDDAAYFQSSAMISDLLRNQVDLDRSRATWISNNLEKIRTTYSWEEIVGRYCELFESLIHGRTESCVK